MSKDCCSKADSKHQPRNSAQCASHRPPRREPNACESCRPRRSRRKRRTGDAMQKPRSLLTHRVGPVTVPGCSRAAPPARPCRCGVPSPRRRAAVGTSAESGAKARPRGGAFKARAASSSSSLPAATFRPPLRLLRDQRPTHAAAALPPCPAPPPRRDRVQHAVPLDAGMFVPSGPTRDWRWRTGVHGTGLGTGQSGAKLVPARRSRPGPRTSMDSDGVGTRMGRVLRKHGASGLAPPPVPYELCSCVARCLRKCDGDQCAG